MILNVQPRFFSSFVPDEGVIQPGPVQLQGFLSDVLPVKTVVHSEKHRKARRTLNASSKPVTNCPFSKPRACPLGNKIYAQAEDEFGRIRSAHRTLAATGCTSEFCQSGRATRTFEPRVGRSRPLQEIKQEAEDFLRECRDNGVIKNDANLNKRIKEAHAEIVNTSIETECIDDSRNIKCQLAGGIWTQAREELEYGIRAAWRNAKRCIMRSEHRHLSLCDLRHVTSSAEMGRCLMKEMLKAFSGGRIQPTAFMFPPRRPGTRGPMIWNEQILAFAGYLQNDGSVLGDPKNVQLTEAIIELGWTPPATRSRWDLLPLVTMAEDDVPILTEIPLELQKLVNITHPRFKSAFAQLDLNWVAFPALSRLGFDIGGVQYTASPFIGWFMDAEIGVRNLADISRYNVLPDVVRACQLSDRDDASLEDLPEYMRMAALSRAQTELTYAVYFSFMEQQVKMSDTMTASLDYMQFDDEHHAEKGYRLPADPYWLSPPQGSIAPIWHRGSAPNYQPKPLIARHVQDPIKVWKREAPKTALNTVRKGSLSSTQTNRMRPRIQIFTCSSGITAGKLARRLFHILETSPNNLIQEYQVEKVCPLNTLMLQDSKPKDVILIIASTTGRGEIPSNAKEFFEFHTKLGLLKHRPRYSIFANGDSTYGDTYNAAASTLDTIFSKLRCIGLLKSVFAADTAKQNPDWSSFYSWANLIQNVLIGKISVGYQLPLPKYQANTQKTSMSSVNLLKVVRHSSDGLAHVTFDMGDLSYQEMDQIKLIVPNTKSEVTRTVAALGVSGSLILPWNNQPLSAFLSDSVDLRHGFKSLNWYQDLENSTTREKESLRTQSVIDILENRRAAVDTDLLEQICKDMPSIAPRVYSAASSPAATNGRHLEIIVKVNRGGRFSDKFLNQTVTGSPRLRLGLVASDCWRTIKAQTPGDPLIVIATGSGIGPIRALLQHRVATFNSATPNHSKMNSHCDANGKTDIDPDTATNADHMSSASSPTSLDEAQPLRPLPENKALQKMKPMSLFVGFKREDGNLIEDIIRPARETGLLDTLELCASNPRKTRIQDALLKPHVRDNLVRNLRHPRCVVFVCANSDAADAAAANLSHLLDEDVKEILGDRYLEEVFRS